MNYYSLFRIDEQGETKLHKLAQNEDQHSDFFSLLEKIPYEDKYQVLMFENNDCRSSYSLMHDKGSDEDVARLDFILGEALYDITENTESKLCERLKSQLGDEFKDSFKDVESIPKSFGKVYKGYFSRKFGVTPSSDPDPQVQISSLQKLEGNKTKGIV